MVGCGFYADDEMGGASSTGWGESIAKVILARMALHHLEMLGDPQAAARAAIQILIDKVKGRAASSCCRPTVGPAGTTILRTWPLPIARRGWTNPWSGYNPTSRLSVLDKPSPKSGLVTPLAFWPTCGTI